MSRLEQYLEKIFNEGKTVIKDKYAPDFKKITRKTHLKCPKCGAIDDPKFNKEEICPSCASQGNRTKMKMVDK